MSGLLDPQNWGVGGNQPVTGLLAPTRPSGLMQLASAQSAAGPSLSTPSPASQGPSSDITIGYGSSPFGRFIQGAVDPLLGVAQLYTNLSPFRWQMAPGWNKSLSDQEANYQAQRKAVGDTGFDWWRLAENVVSPLNAVTELSVPSRLGQAVLAGATLGGMQPVWDAGSGADYAVKKLQQAGTGAAFDAGFSRLNPVLQSAARTIFASHPHMAGWLATILNQASPSFPTAATYATLQKPQDGKP